MIPPAPETTRPGPPSPHFLDSPMQTLLIAVLGLLPPKPALAAPAEPDLRTEAGSAAQPRSIPSGCEAMLDQLSTAADDSRAILATQLST